MFSHDVIVIGGGAAGLSAAAGTAQLGLKTALIDRDKLGGDCLHFGCVPSKSLIKTADYYYELKNSKELGLPEIIRPNIDIETINQRIQKIIKTIEHHDSPERFKKLGCEVYLDSVRFLDRHTVITGDGKKMSAKKIIVATGSSPRMPVVKGLVETGFITNRDAFSLKKLPTHLITIGSGPIGIELSQAFLRLGVKVSLITHSANILSKDDKDMTDYVKDDLVESGVNITFNSKILKVEKCDNEKVVHYSVDGKNYTIKGDEILLAVGREGNSEGLDLEKIGVKLKHKYIVVDKYLRSTVKNIMAIGDINGQYLFTHVAGAEASIAIKKTVFGLKSTMNYSKVPWCTYTKPEIASIGYNELRAKKDGIKYTVVEANIEDNDRAHAEGKTVGKIKVLIDKKERVIGTQIVADHAGELILPSIMTLGKKLMTLMSPIYPYPTLGEIHRKVAGNYYGPKLFNKKIRKVLRFLFHYRGRI